MMKREDCCSMFLLRLFGYQVTHRNTGQEMVMKELISCDEEGKKTFLQEVLSGVIIL